MADVGAVRGSVVDEKGSIEVLVPDQAGVDSGARGVVDGEVAEFVVATEQVALLLVHHQFLDHFTVFQHVEMQARSRLARPRRNVKSTRVRHRCYCFCDGQRQRETISISFTYCSQLGNVA